MAKEPVVVAPVPPPVSIFDGLSERLDEDDKWHRNASPPWILTFADMITLLLAFFVLLLSFSDLNVTRFRDVTGSLQKSLGNEDALPIVVAPPAETQLAAGPSTAITQNLSKLMAAPPWPQPQPQCAIEMDHCRSFGPSPGAANRRTRDRKCSRIRCP